MAQWILELLEVPSHSDRVNAGLDQAGFDMAEPLRLLIGARQPESDADIRAPAVAVFTDGSISR